MVSEIPLLQNVKIAAPCHASWSDMTEVDGDRVRHCDSCALNVYNLSAMTQAEAEGLLRKHEGRLCVRYYRRDDGTILTRDCPIGAHNARLLLMRRSVTAAALLALGALSMAATSLLSDPPRVQGAVADPQIKVVQGSPAAPDIRPIETSKPAGSVEVLGQISIEPIPHSRPVSEMGKVARHNAHANP
jgi:hypothetical protein